MKYRGRYETPEEFENIVVRTNANGDVLYLKDVADVELGKVTYDYTSSLNGKPATMAIVFRDGRLQRYRNHQRMPGTG